MGHEVLDGNSSLIDIHDNARRALLESITRLKALLHQVPSMDDFELGDRAVAHVRAALAALADMELN
jgi:hypothetical protein